MGRQDKPIVQDEDSFGARLRRRRQAAKMSLSDMALKMGYTKGYVSNIENGVAPPTDLFGAKVVKIFGEPLTDDKDAAKIAEIYRQDQDLIRTVICDPSPFFAECLSLALHRRHFPKRIFRFNVIATVNTREDLLAKIQEEEFNVNLILLTMIQPLNGMTEFLKFKEQMESYRSMFSAKTILLVADLSPLWLEQIYELPAQGYISHDWSNISSLLNAVESSLVSEKYIDPPIQINMARNRVNAATTVLTSREEEILRCMVYGYSNEEIADYLTLAPETVKSHISNILKKFVVESRAKAVARALEYGFVSFADMKKKYPLNY